MKKLVLVFSLIFVQWSVVSQDLSKEDLAALKETVAIELNASLFIPGESVYLSVSARDLLGSYSALSKVIYVEVIDQEKRSVLQEKIGLQGGKGAGTIYLPSYLKTGSYTVIAYTKWMKNYDSQFIPQRAIKIVNPYEKLPNGFFEQKKPEQVKALFKPVGEYYVLGEKQEVRFLTTDQDGLGVRVTGRLTDSSGSVVTEFESDSEGIGTLEFIPEKNQTYQAVLVDAYERIHFAELKIDKIRSDKLRLQETTEAFTWDTSSDLTLEVWNGGVLVQTLQGASKLDKSTLPTGTLIVRFLNETGVEVYKQGLYNPPSDVAVTIDMTRSLYKPRQRVEMIIGIMDSLSAGDISLSVRKKVQGENEDNQVRSYFLEDARLRNSAKEKLPNALKSKDLLISSDTKVMSSSVELTYLPDLRGNLIEGILKDNLQQPMALRDVSLSIPSRPHQLYTTTTNEQGELFFSTNFTSFPGEYVFYVEGGNADHRITLDDPFLGEHDFVEIEPFSFSPDLKDWLVQKSIEVQVENAYYQSKVDSTFQEDIARLLPDVPMKTYVLDDFTRFPTVEDHITEYVSEVAVRERVGGIGFLFPFLENKSGAVDTVLAMMNGVPVAPRQILEFNSLEIERIDVYNAQVKVGAWEFAGILNFQTFDSSIDILELPSSHKALAYKSPVLAKDFMTPKYEDDALKRIPDFRSQLAWEPHLDLSVGSHTLEFYTSDSPGIYEVVITGIVGNDRYVLERTEFEVAE